MPFCIGWVKNFDEITLSCTVKKIEANFCFSIFGKNLKIQNGRHFWEQENFLKIAKSTFLRYHMGRKFHRNNSILHSYGKFVFFHFWQKFENSKWPQFLGRGNFFESSKDYIPLWVKNFDEIALSRMVKEIEANLCFAIFGKNSKIQNGHLFWGGENFLKIAKSTMLRYLMG